MSNKTLLIISNKEIDEKELLEAIQQLSDVNESADFWNDIAKNSGYGKLHRAHCIFQLFKRHISVGMNLYRFGELLRNPTWLKNEDIEIVNALNGEIPVTWTLNDTIFVFRIFPELSNKYSFAIYLRILGKIDRNDLIWLLRGNEVNQVMKNVTILEVGFTGNE